MAAIETSAAVQHVTSTAVPSEEAHRANTLLSNANYAMTQTYGAALQHVPFSAQQVGMLPGGYTPGIHSSAGLQELTAYQTNMNAHMAQYQAAQALANASTFSPEATKLLKNRSMYGLGGVNPGQRHGRWSEDEHKQFLSLMQKYGRSWTKISQVMMTRSEPQVRSHAQKHFLRISRLEKQAAGTENSPDKDGKSEDAGNASSDRPSAHFDSVEEGIGLSEDPNNTDKGEKQKKLKRRRTMNHAPSTTNMTNLGMLGTMPDAAALVTMAAQAAAASQQQVSQRGMPECVSTAKHSMGASPGSTTHTTSAVPQAVLRQSISLQQQPHNQLAQQAQQHQQGQHHAQLATNSAYSAGFLQNLQAPYTMHHLHASLSPLQQAQVFGHASYYNYMPFVRTDASVTNPSWHSLAVATSVGMVGSQSPWILPMQIGANSVVQQNNTNAAFPQLTGAYVSSENPTPQDAYAQASHQLHQGSLPSTLLDQPAYSQHVESDHQPTLVPAGPTTAAPSDSMGSVGSSLLVTLPFVGQDPAKCQAQVCNDGQCIQDEVNALQPRSDDGLTLISGSSAMAASRAECNINQVETRNAVGSPKFLIDGPSTSTPVPKKCPFTMHEDLATDERTLDTDNASLKLEFKRRPVSTRPSGEMRSPEERST